MLRLRVFRDNGDSLSCYFSPEGSLSSAVLVVEEGEYDVTSQLPGLDASNALSYLYHVDYTMNHDTRLIRITRLLNERLRGSPLFVGAVHGSAEEVSARVVLTEDRTKAMCRQSFVVVHNRCTGGVSFRAVRDRDHVRLFQARLRNRFIV